jgi:hypothetical protein
MAWSSLQVLTLVSANLHTRPGYRAEGACGALVRSTTANTLHSRWEVIENRFGNYSGHRPRRSRQWHGALDLGAEPRDRAASPTAPSALAFGTLQSAKKTSAKRPCRSPSVERSESPFKTEETPRRLRMDGPDGAKGYSKVSLTRRRLIVLDYTLCAMIAIGRLDT